MANMEKNSGSVRMITRTALCTALVLAAQLIGRMFPAGLPIYGPFSVNQLVTGSLVNLVLMLTGGLVGLWAGVVCGIVSAVLATLLGMTPVPFIAPAIALGNALIAAIAWVTLNRMPSAAGRAGGLLLGAAAKCAFLWLSVPAILRLLPGVPAQQAKMLSIMFSWPQFITALVGAALVMLTYPPLRRALEKSEL